MFSTPGTCRYHSYSGFLSTARILVNPFLVKCSARLPPMKPPAPVMTIKSSFLVAGPFSTSRFVCSINFLFFIQRDRLGRARFKCSAICLAGFSQRGMSTFDQNISIFDILWIHHWLAGKPHICSTAARGKLKSTRMTKPTLLVLAAGMGSRYGGLKQIDPVGPAGETIIDYSIFDAMRAGFGKLVFVIRKDIEQQFRDIIGTRFEKRIAVEYAYQELDKLPPGYALPAGRTKPWGTTHAILMAEGVVKEPFAAINADDFYGQQAYQLIAQHLTSGTTDCAMVGFILRNTLSQHGSVARGVCRVDEKNHLKSVVEMMKIEPDGGGAKDTDAAGQITKLTGEESVSMNFWGFTAALFPLLRTQFAAFLKQSGRETPKIHRDGFFAGELGD